MLPTRKQKDILYISPPNASPTRRGWMSTGDQTFIGDKSFTNISFDGPIVFANPITPSALTGNTNNYNPAGLSSSNILRISSTGNFNLTGLQAPSPAKGQVILVVNIGTNNITLKNNDAASSAGNRFLAGADKLVQAQESVILVYDEVSLRWRVIAQQI